MEAQDAQFLPAREALSSLSADPLSATARLDALLDAALPGDVAAVEEPIAIGPYPGEPPEAIGPYPAPDTMVIPGEPSVSEPGGFVGNAGGGEPTSVDPTGTAGA